MPSTCFEPGGLSSGRRLYIQLWYGVCFTRISISNPVGRRACSTLFYLTIIAYKTVFLKMNPPVQNI